MTDEEELGGDPPCWAHLFEEEITGLAGEPGERADSSDTTVLRTGSEQMVDLAALTRTATVPGAIWTRQSEDLEINLLVFTSGDGVAEHVNAEVDVLLVGITGSGTVTIDGACQTLSTGQVIVVPKGACRGIKGMSDRFAYLSCHRRRGGLWPH